MAKRPVKIAIISDVHLGTYGCHAEELNHYLISIDPELEINQNIDEDHDSSPTSIMLLQEQINRHLLTKVA